MKRVIIQTDELKFHITDDTGIPGTFLLVAIDKQLAAPVGSVYLRITYDLNIEILDSYVHEQYRRNGIRTKLNEKIFELFPNFKKIVTMGGTRLGKKFMEKSNYEKNELGFYSKKRENGK